MGAPFGSSCFSATRALLGAHCGPLGGGHALESHHRHRRQPLQGSARRGGGGRRREAGHRRGGGRHRRGGVHRRAGAHRRCQLELHPLERFGCRFGCWFGWRGRERRRDRCHRRGGRRGASQIRRRGAHRNGHGRGGHGRPACRLRARVVPEPEDRRGGRSGRRQARWVHAVRWGIRK